MTDVDQTKTTITMHRGREYGPPLGPTECTSCGRTLLDRSPDETRDGVIHQTNEEVIDHIWEHETDDHGQPICGRCVEEQGQGDAWLALARWAAADPASRALHLARDRLLVVHGGQQEAFACTRGLLCTGAVHTFLASFRPLPAFVMMAGAVSEARMLTEIAAVTQSPTAYTRAMSDADELEAAHRFARAEEECPKTERNTEHV